MGIETAIIIGLGVAAAASSGYQAKRAHDTQVNAKHEADRQQQAQAAIQTEATDKEKQGQLAQAQAAARARSRATAAYSNPAASLPGTMTGGLGSSNGKQSTLLGL